MNLTFKQLRYFIATADLGQVSLAAKSLCISQSAITTAIKDLESQLQQKLFLRTSEGMRLSQFGMLFLPKAQTILLMLDDISQFSYNHDEVRGKIKIGVTYTVIGYFLPAHLQRIRYLYPNLDLDIVEMSRHNIEKALHEGELDCGLLLTSNIHSSEIRYETFFNSKRRLWVASSHKLLNKSMVSLQDIINEPYIMLDVDESKNTTQHYWRDNLSSPNISITTTSVEAIRSMVANNNGVTILSDMVYRPWSLEGKKIETIILSDKIPPMSVGMAWHKDQYFSTALTTLRNYFYQSFINM